MAERLGLYLQDRYTLQESIRYVQYAELRGFDVVWQAENRFSRDAIVPMAAYASSTHRIRIGAGVINNWTRHPVLIASTFLTLDDLAPERMICGIDAMHEPLAQMMGIQRRKPLLAIRETVTVIRALLAGETVSFDGEYIQIKNVSLVSSQDRLMSRHVPIYIGATGAKMTALAGELADGVLLNYLVSPEYNNDVIAELKKGAKKAGRTIDSIDRPQLVICSVDRDRTKALNNARRLVTYYILQQPNVMRASGVSQLLIDEVHQIAGIEVNSASINEAMLLVPDQVVQMVTASGSAEEVRQKVQSYIDSGASYPVLYPLCDDVRYMIDVFTDKTIL